MAEPAITAALEAVISAVEAIEPTIDPGTRFRRQSETGPSSTKAGKRLFDIEFEGHPRDLSNEGAGVQNPGLADRLAAVTIHVDYPLGRAEKQLEAILAVDSELVLRALGRSADWSDTPIRRVVATSTVDRTQREPVLGAGAGFLVLVVNAEIQYRDAE